MITIQIGNSDDKLSQRDWAAFIKQIRDAAEADGNLVHFAGGSNVDVSWQNYCICLETHSPETRDKLKSECVKIKKRFNQDFIAWTEGPVEFI